MISGGQPISFQIDANLNQHVESGAGVPPGVLKELINLRKDRDGRLAKRCGYAGTAVPPSLFGAVRGFDLNGQSVLINEMHVQAYGAGQDKWTNVDRPSYWTLESATRIQGDTSGWHSSGDNLFASADAQNLGYRMYPGCAVGGGIVVHVWVYKQHGEQFASSGYPAPDQDRHGVYVMVTDETSGAVLRQPQRISTAASGTDIINMARVTFNAGTFWIVWSVIPEIGDGSGSSTGALWSLTRTTAQMADGATTLPAGSAVKSDLMRSAKFGGGSVHHSTFDICSHTITGTGPRCFVIYTRDVGPGTRTLACFRIDTSNAATASVDVTAALGRAASIASRVGDGRVWIAYVLPLTAANTVVVDSVVETSFAGSGAPHTFTPSTGTTAIVSTGLGTIAGTANAVMVTANAQTAAGAGVLVGLMTWGIVVLSAGAPVSSGPKFERFDLVASSQPFHNGTDFYVWADIGGPDTGASPRPTRAEWIALSSTVLVALTFGNTAVYASAAAWVTSAPQLRVAAGRTNWGVYADNYPNIDHATLHAAQKPWGGTVDASLYFWDGSTVVLSSVDANSLQHIRFGATGITEYRFRRILTQNGPAHVVDYAGRVAVLSGGTMLNQFDGQQFTEVGFCQAPRLDAIGAGGVDGDVAAGAYNYAVVYEYTDAAGNVHQSFPMVKAFTLAGDDSVKLTIRTLNITTKLDAELSFRGTVSTAEADACVQIVVYRSTVGPSQQLYRVGSVLNAHNVQTVDFIDYSSDANISAGPVLYSLAELVNEMPPCTRHAVQFKNRLALIDAENEGRIAFSKPLRIGRGPEFSGVLETYVRDIGKLTALAAMDGVLYAFSATGIAVAAYGDGQDATGGGSWPQPEVISRAAGCVDARALCVTQEGIVFCCKRGDSDKVAFSIWLLPRGGGNIVEIGKKVHWWLRGITSLVTVPPSDVLGCVNWVADSRVVVNLKYSNASTYQLEYDYGNRGEDGQGVWNATQSLADGYKVGCSWVSDGRHWLAVKTTDGYVMRSKANVFCDTPYTGGTEAWIAYVLETHSMKFGSLAPRGTLNFINVEFATWYNSDNPRNSNIKWTVWGDAASPVTTTMLVDAYESAMTAGYIELRARREWAPPVRRDDLGAGVTLRLESVYIAQTIDNADMIPLLVHVDYIAQKGTRRPVAAQRV